MDATALADVIAAATSVRVTGVGELDPRHRNRTKPLAIVSDTVALTCLCDALAVDPESLLDRRAWTTPGTRDLHFFRGHDLLATVSYIPPDFIRWSGWRADARLTAPAALATWLSDHGC